MSKLFQPWVPEYIIEVIEKSVWVTGGQWDDSTGQSKIAKRLCLSSNDSAKRAWEIFNWHKHQLVYNGSPIKPDNPTYEKDCKHTAQRFFVRCLKIADIVLNDFSEQNLLTRKRLKNIEKQAGELARLLNGIEGLIPKYDTGQQVRMIDDRLMPIFNNGFSINQSLEHLQKWANGYEKLEISDADCPLEMVTPDWRKGKKPKWFVWLLLNGNEPQNAQALANLTNFIFEEIGETISSKDIDQIRPTSNV